VTDASGVDILDGECDVADSGTYRFFNVSSRMADHVVNGVIASAARRGLSMPSSYRSGAAPLVSCASESSKEEVT
jgi:hypothetical protein